MDFDDKPLFPDPRVGRQKNRIENQQRNLTRKLLETTPSRLSEELILLHKKITKKTLPPLVYGVFMS